MIRIIGGQLRGRSLQVPEGQHVRPSSGRLREALFSMLDHRINWQGFIVLDLFAGSGALGIEALSRGAERAYFVDCSRKNLKILCQNLNACGYANTSTTTISERAERWIRKFPDPGQPGLVFIDPPYQEGYYEPILSIIASLPSIHPHSLIAVEAPKTLQLKLPETLSVLNRKIYGTVALQLLEKPPEKTARI